MPKKRRNNGRGKKHRGNTTNVRCSNCGRCVSKDKAIKRFMVRNIVDGSSMRDIKENRAYENFTFPKFFIKLEYCISCGIHGRVVRVRKVSDRRIREAPKRPRMREDDRKRPTG